jgi:hypothetical protein
VFTMLCILIWTYPSFRLLITQVHYDMLGRVWLVLGLAWAYLFFNDFLPAYYAHKADKMDYLYYNAFGAYAPHWWMLVIGNFVVPLMCLAFQEFRRSIFPMFVLSIIVNICMYLERVVIIIPGLEIYNKLNYNILPYSDQPHRVLHRNGNLRLGYRWIDDLLSHLPNSPLLGAGRDQVSSN